LLFHVLLPDKDRLSYEEINTKTIQLFEKFIAQNGKSNPVEIDKGLVRIISVILNLRKRDSSSSSFIIAVLLLI
jgi:hypothetical protein